MAIVLSHSLSPPFVYNLTIMRTLVLAAILTLPLTIAAPLCQAAPIILEEPIPISGGGTFGTIDGRPFVQMNFSGQLNGIFVTIGAFVSGIGVINPDIPELNICSPCLQLGSAHIQGIGIIEQPWFMFSFYGEYGTGILTILDSGIHPMATAKLYGDMTWEYTRVGPHQDIAGNFSITQPAPVHMPEPSTWVLMLTGLLLANVYRRRRHQ